MRKSAPTLPVSTDMLRHFAVLTVVITAGLAMFANGENENVIAEQIRQREMKNQALRMEREKASQRTVVIDGLRVAPGTRVGSADVDTDHFTTTGISGGGDYGDGYSLPAAYRPVGNPNAEAVEFERDANGMPIAPTAAFMRKGLKPGQRQSPVARERRTKEGVDAIIQASEERAGAASTNQDSLE